MYAIGTEQHRFSFEYISLVMFSNTTMLNKTFCSKHRNLSVCQHESQPEFVFRYYLKNAYPDLLLMFTTFGHDVRVPFADEGRLLSSLLHLIHDTLPTSSQAVWLTTTAPKLRKFPEYYDDIIAEKHLNREQKTEMLNHYFYEIFTAFRPTGPGPQQHSFLDLMQMGRKKEQKWAHDRIHFHPQFYQGVMAHLINFLPSLQNNTVSNSIAIKV